VILCLSQKLVKINIKVRVVVFLIKNKLSYIMQQMDFKNQRLKRQRKNNIFILKITEKKNYEKSNN